MKPIIISNRASIEKALKEVQGKAYERIIDYDKLLYCISEVEKRISKLGIEKKYWDNIHIYIGPDLYQIKGRYSKMCSFATLIYQKRKWRLIEIDRHPEWKKCRHSKITYEVETSLPSTALVRINNPRFDLN